MKKRKKNKPNWFLIMLGFLIICGSFVFSIRQLSDPITPAEDSAVETPSKVTKQEFLDKIVPHAQELQQGYGVLPSIIIGQAILESNWGTSQLAAEYYNLFGVKAYGDQKAITLDTKEFVNEQWVTIKGNFRVYQSWDESLDDHTQLLVNGVSWNPQKYEKVLTANSYKDAALALQEAGYATDPSYAAKIESVIESYQLTKYDH
jgi:flagellum-specific peptidoglycan hydrolase FlgJ